jgi:hypothetical protein
MAVMGKTIVLLLYYITIFREIQLFFGRNTAKRMQTDPIFLGKDYRNG